MQVVPVGALREVLGEVIGSEEPTVGVSRNGGGLVGLAEAGDTLGSGEDVWLVKHRLKLPLCLFRRQLDGLCLGVRPEEMGRGTVDNCYDELQLGLAAARGEHVAERLPGWRTS